jgi:hypothetical protein
MKKQWFWALGVLAAVPLATSPLCSSDKEEGSTVAIKATDDRLEFWAGKSLVGTYHKGADVAKPYFWPVNGPFGAPVTRGWPMVPLQKGGSKDHVHQKSVWFCHGDVIPEGIEIKDKIKGVQGVDFWSEAKGHGKIVCTEVLLRKLGRKPGNYERVDTHNEWQTADGTKILDEDRTIRFYSYGETRLFVLDIDLHASVVPITFGDTKEGSMGVRVNDAMREKGGKGKLVNADGKTGMRQIWGYRSAWCDYSGPIEGKVVGITIFDHPDNPYPALWHSRDYGLMAANPFGRAHSGFPDAKGNTELVKLAKGKHLKLRYGILIHPGDVKEGKVAEFYDRYTKLKK